MKLSLGFSPCPNDTFIFDALVHQKIDTEGLEFEYVLADVEELNLWAMNQRLDITKTSFHAFLYLTNNYILLNSGAALGFGTGPLLIAKNQPDLRELPGMKIAIPGRYTTANLLISFAYPEASNKIEFLFSEIENAVLDGKVDAGVIIHENRFTYQDKGLVKVTDLGLFWENHTGNPIPLGGIVARKSLPAEVLYAVDRVLRRSVEYALENNVISSFVSCNAQEMKEEVMRKHIELYVNKFSINLGEEGIGAVHKLFEMAHESSILDKIPENYRLNYPE
ncbi:MAG: 1,4-dihydroxy-6-naphthoate synthase [Bacteroidales bacterium]|nr:1,4-dihydroxy-6-naphthoate synthase [Bacteroidales bacterium]